jgi:hypothetical protein
MKNCRNTAGQFASGNSGKPKGSRNKVTIAIEGLLQGQAEALTQTAVTKALEGDSVALRLCMERIAPAPKDHPVSFSLPNMNNALIASEAAGSILIAVVQYWIKASVQLLHAICLANYKCGVLQAIRIHRVNLNSVIS